MSWPFRFVVTVLAGALLMSGVAIGVAPQAWSAMNAHSERAIVLPSFVPLAQRSYVYDVNGDPIAILNLENSQPIPLAEVPEPVIDALLAVEDETFYSHEGVNLRALTRALLSNFQTGTIRQGASTITQQVVKNEFLGGLERDGRYKLLQARYAMLLERTLTKEEILERYLNTVFFGNNAYGIQAASETYFGKPASQLTMIEGAFLAGLVQAPSSFDPIRRPERSRRRFVQVLDRLVVVGLIEERQAELLGESWPLPERVRSETAEQELPRTYFTEAVKDYLLNRSDVLGDTYQERYNQLFRGGIHVFTTFNPVLQTLAEEARFEHLPFNSAGVEAAVLSLDTATGAVRAMVGGQGFRPGVNEVNLALRRRQTGSAVKFFVLAAAVQAGAQGNDLIDGTRPCTLPNPGDPRDPFEITGGVSRPTSSLREMTAASINCAYARLSQIVGLNRVVDTTYRMASSPYLTGNPAVDGSGGQTYRIEPFASFATGANEMSPMDMAAGFQTIANRGIHHEPYYVERILSVTGDVVYEHRADGIEVFDVEAADRTIDILKSPLINGTARNSRLADGRPAAGKTGTQENNTNAWFVGATPQLVTAVWVGDPRAYTPMVNIPEFSAVGVSRVQGSTFPAAIWKAYMDAALIFQPHADWDAPAPNPRGVARLYLPGNECLATVVSVTVPVVPEETTPPIAVPPIIPPIGNMAPVEPIVPDTTAPPDPPDTEVPPDTEAPPSTQPPPPRQVATPIESGTTIPPDVLDPLAPLPSVAPGVLVYDCAGGIPPTFQPTPPAPEEN